MPLEDKKILVTGSRGFSAKYLIELLQKETSHQIFCDEGDLSQLTEVENLLQRVRPDQIYHLAGSFTNHYETDYKNNVLTTKNIFDALLVLGMKARVLIIGSAAEYGVPRENPISENSPLEPVTIYGVTKTFQTHLMQFYTASHHLDIVMARPFNLFGLGISEQLFIGKVYAQIERFKEGLIDKIVLDDLSGERDYIDIEEAVRWYQKIMEKGVSGK